MLHRALVLTAAPGSSTLERSHASEIWSRLPAAHRKGSRWLSAGEAWEASFVAEDEREAEGIRTIAEDMLAPLPVDVNMVPDEGDSRRKKLLVADLESTIIAEECLDELAGHAGLREAVSAITLRAMRGEVVFEDALRERVRLLAGLDAKALDEVCARLTLTPGAETLVATMKRHGARCALVSGGFTFFSERIAERLAFHTHQANTLEISDGKLTGRVSEPILGRDAKRAALERFAAELGLSISNTLAVGDGANDLAMIKAAGLGVAFRAKPVVAREARASIVHSDLTALLYLQGYRRDEFVC
jgi:phosphoserine phosphatase